MESMKPLKDYLVENLVFESKKNNIFTRAIDFVKLKLYKAGIFDVLPKSMPVSFTSLVFSIASEMKNIVDVTKEEEIKKCFISDFDRFWDEYYKYFSKRVNIHDHLDTVNDDINNVWNTWKDQIIYIFQNADNSALKSQIDARLNKLAQEQEKKDAKLAAKKAKKEQANNNPLW